MIAYEKLPLDNEVKAALEGLEIEYSSRSFIKIV